MRTKNELKKRFNELTEIETGKFIQENLNFMILSLRVKDMTDEELHFIYKSLFDTHANTGMTLEIYLEYTGLILRDFKRYTPLCFASFQTALNVYKTK